MSNYIRVFGPNPDYKGSKMYFFLHTSLVTKIYPVWAEVKDGKAWLCTPNHPNAQVVSCTLVDHAGHEYSCGKVEELSKLLAEDDLCRLLGKKPPEPEKKHFGFIHKKDKPDEQLDLTVETVEESAGPPAPIADREAWLRFLERTAGSITDPTFQRHPQGEYEQRESLP